MFATPQASPDRGFILTIEQSVEPLAGERTYRIGATARPAKSLLLESLVPDDEANALPHEELRLAAPRVDEHENRPRYRVLVNDGLRRHRQAVNQLVQVDRCTMQ